MKDIGLWNIAAIGKLVWDLASKKDNLWVRWISGVYLRSTEFWQHECPVASSWYWKKLCEVRDRLAAGFVGSVWETNSTGVYTVALGYRWLIGE